MRYLALLYGPETEADDPTTEAFDDEVARYRRFNELARDALRGGEALRSRDAAVSVRYGSDGDPIVTDGVFTEAAEVIGSLYVLEVDDLDAAIELAAHIPAALKGAVELRPVVEWFEVDRDLPAAAQRYLALLMGPETTASHPGTPEWEVGVEAHNRFGERAGDAVLGGGALQPAETGTVVQVRGGERLITEGTYAEAHEVVGGLYLLWATSRDEVLALALHVPMGAGGIVEVRPILEFDT